MDIGNCFTWPIQEITSAGCNSIGRSTDYRAGWNRCSATSGSDDAMLSQEIHIQEAGEIGSLSISASEVFADLWEVTWFSSIRKQFHIIYLCIIARIYMPLNCDRRHTPRLVCLHTIKIALLTYWDFHIQGGNFCQLCSWNSSRGKPTAEATCKSGFEKGIISSLGLLSLFHIP